MSVLEECSREELNEKEIYYIQKFDSVNNGYNQVPGGNQRTAMLGEKHHMAKLTDEEVYFVRGLYDQHISFKEVYEQYGKGMSISGFRKI